MRFLPRIVTLTCLFGLFSACAVSLDDRPNDRDKYSYEYGVWDSQPNSSTYNYVQCSGSGASSRLCGVRPNSNPSSPAAHDEHYSWQSNCRGSDCQILNVFAHYTLQENLGSNQTLVIEAFQNAQFAGSPAANIQISGFDATRPGSTDLEELYLAPGEYYFRSYFTTGQAQATPYSMDGMILIGDKPVGVYGALSGAKRVVVKSGEKPETVHIYINQLFKKPGSEPDSNAHLRLQIAAAFNQSIPADRNIRILLLSKPDIETAPTYTFTLSSNLLLVKGREYSTEFVTPSLKTGAYYVFVFIDSNGNNFYEPTELGAFYLENQDVSSLTVTQDQTHSLQLFLQPSTSR